MEYIKDLFFATDIDLFPSEKKRCSLGDNDLNTFLEGIPTDTGLITIAGESGMGKSRLLKTLLYHLSICQKIPCAYISGRKHRDREADVFLAGTLGLSFDEMKNASINKMTERVRSAEKQLHDSPLYYMSIQNNELDIEELKRVSFMAVRNHGVKFLFIDGFQQIKYTQAIGADIRYQEQLKSLELKRISLELNIPIIVTSRLNWVFYTQEHGFRPTLQDLSESGELAEISNMIITIFRPETYGIYFDSYSNCLRGTTELTIIKNNFGEYKNGTFYTNGPIFDYRYMFENTRFL